jgi:hypothetical protein
MRRAWRCDVAVCRAGVSTSQSSRVKVSDTTTSMRGAQLKVDHSVIVSGGRTCVWWLFLGLTQNCRAAGSPTRRTPIEDLDDAENLMIKRAALILTLWCGSITEMALEKLDDMGVRI